MRWALALLVVAACGDNMVVAEPPAELVFVAHQDDDLLFMQSDLYPIVSEHRPIEVVYVTAGDGGSGAAFSEARYRAVRFAYGSVAGSKKWDCTWTLVHGHAAQQCRLLDRPVTLLFLGYPDGGIGGSAPESLLRLWNGEIESATTISARPTTYTQEELIATAASIIEETDPKTIRTLEISATHGYDHSDHMMVGSLTQLALARTASHAEIVAYRGYNIQDEPANVDEDEYMKSSLFMRSYASCFLGCGACDETPCDSVPDGWYDGFLHRKYAVGTQEPATGVLTSQVGCLGVTTSDDATLVNCDHAPDLTLDDQGFVRIDDQCLEIDTDGTLDLGVCEEDPRRYFQLDDEGHLWSGVIPSQMSDLFDHGTCVYVDQNHVKAGLCGADREWRWTLRP
ncbi:MAG TPA: PIG-L family deacetylase [Kofleriaceae bacterium]|nr:PIG-L family deacetylase [Kofleriaceae bacterium]